MDLTPREIQEKQFHDVFRGYNHEEVDVFLDEVAEAFERTYRENQSFHHRLRDLEEQLKTARATEDMLKRTLITAQKTAEEAVDEARSRAQGLVAEAEKKSAEVVAAAEERAKQIVDEANGKQSDLETKLDGLRRFEQEYRTRLNAFIESQLQVLAEGPVAPAKPKPDSKAPVAEEPVTKPDVAPSTKPVVSDAILPKKDQPAAPFVSRPSTPQPSPPTRPASATPGEAVKPAVESPRDNGGEGRPKTQQSNGGSGGRPLTSVETSSPAKPKSEAARPPVTSPAPKPAVMPKQQEKPAEVPAEEELDEESIRKLFWGEE